MAINGVIWCNQKADGLYEKDGFDQIAWLVNEIKTNPNSMPSDCIGLESQKLGRVALPQVPPSSGSLFITANYSCQLIKRSADVF